MALLIVATTNQFQYSTNGQLVLPPFVHQCSVVVVTEREYSAFDVLSRKRYLHKLFSTSEPKKQFDYNSPFDCYRVLSLFCMQLASEVLSSNFKPEIVKRAEPYIYFVSKPVFPIVLQQVGLGINYDIKINGYPYKVITDGKLLPYGYNVLYDLTPNFKLDSDKVQYILLNYKEKDILVPGTEQYKASTIVAKSALFDKEVEYNYDSIWVTPKVQYCKWSELRQHLRFKE